MYSNNAPKTVEMCVQSPVILSNNAIIELALPITSLRPQEGFIIVNLQACRTLCQDQPEKELLLK